MAGPVRRRGLDGLADLPRPGRPRRISEMDRAAVVALASSCPPPPGCRWAGAGPELAARAWPVSWRSASSLRPDRGGPQVTAVEECAAALGDRPVRVALAPAVAADWRRTRCWTSNLYPPAWRKATPPAIGSGSVVSGMTLTRPGPFDDVFDVQRATAQPFDVEPQVVRRPMRRVRSRPQGTTPAASTRPAKGRVSTPRTAWRLRPRD